MIPKIKFEIWGGRETEKGETRQGGGKKDLRTSGSAQLSIDVALSKKGKIFKNAVENSRTMAKRE